MSRMLGAALALALFCAGIGAESAAALNVSSPTIDRTGRTLTVTSAGTWLPDGPKSYQWQRCTLAGASCVDIAGATGTSYHLVYGDQNHSFQVVETVPGLTNGSANSNQVAVPADPPVNVSDPTISGTPKSGSTLTASPGTWSNREASDPGFTYQWKRCLNGSCSAIPGATGTTYKLTDTDIGKSIRVAVTAYGLGSATDESGAVGPIQAVPPTNISRPTISGTPDVGERLVASTGFWTGTGAITFTAQWIRCNPRCAVIPGETNATYLVGEPDRGARLVVRITATNVAGSTSAFSGATDLVPTLGSGGGDTTDRDAGTPLRRIRPFPVVTIGGVVFGRATRVMLLAVQAPRGSKASVRCRGRGCPFRRASKRVGRRKLVAFKSMRRVFRAGTVIEVRVTKGNRIGKYTRFRIRRGRAPSRIDRCLIPGRKRPVRCAS